MTRKWTPRALRLGIWLSALVAVAVGLASADSTVFRYADAYAKLLEKHTEAVHTKVGTRVDYSRLRTDPAWKAMLAELRTVDPAGLKTREEQLAFWINTYNILAIDLVLNHYPVESIKDIGSLFRSVWKVEAGRIAGRDYSLDEIEHQIIRPMHEPRIHAAIVCASISCPNLLREPYVAERLDEQLDASFRAWLMRPEKGLLVDRVGSALRISPIFEWFEDDFGGRAEVLVFVARYAPRADAAWIREQGFDVKVDYFDYDWRLNE
jgi:hypothetical protein